MCVIICGSAANKPTDEQLEQCWARNPHGAGIAHYDSQGRIVWRKGIRDLDEVVSFVHNVQQQWIVHMRFITVGGDHDVLCHPFPISKESPASTSGSGSGPVLFHNGTVRDWQRMARDLSISDPDAVIPDGRLSDSRIVAWLCAHKGYRFLRLLDQGRFAVMTTNRGVRLFPENGSGRNTWHKIGGCFYSNRDWLTMPSRDGSGRTGGAKWGPDDTSRAWAQDSTSLTQRTLPGVDSTDDEEWRNRQGDLPEGWPPPEETA